MTSSLTKKRDLRPRLREAENKADFWVSMSKPERGGEYPKRARVSARKAKKGLARTRRRLDAQVIEEEDEA